jgi:hypothetical protein
MTTVSMTSAWIARNATPALIAVLLLLALAAVWVVGGAPVWGEL